MSSLEIYDPAMCCSTGVCGPSVDPALTQFAADVAWLDTAGIDVHRYGLASEPGRFVAHSEVQAVLVAQGEKGLPAVVVDGDLKSTGRYPSRTELAAWTGAPTPSQDAAPSQDSCCGAPAAAGLSLLPVAAASEGACCAPGEC